MGAMSQKIKGALIISLVLAFIIVVVSALFPSEVMTSKWVMLGAEKQLVHEKLNDLHDFASWNDVMMNQDELKVHSKSNTAQKGDMISWRNNVGTFDALLVTSNDSTGIGFDMIKPGELPIQSGISIAQKGDSVQVVWFIIEKLRWYPWEKVYGMMASDIKGPAMQHSLETFKSQLENQ
jgi:hypothetical protein